MDEQVAYWMSGWVGQAQPFCEEPVFAASLVQGSGGWASGVKGGLFGGFVGRSARRDAAERAGGLPDPAVIVVGARKVYVFAYSQRKGIHEPPVTIWDRSDVQVTADDRRVASKVSVRVQSTGAVHELESVSMTGRMGKMHNELVRVLSDPAAS